MEMQSKARPRIFLLTLRLWGQVIILNFASDLLTEATKFTTSWKQAVRRRE